MPTKTKKASVKKWNGRATEEEKLKFMLVLEQNHMNVARTARELGIGRSSLLRYKDQVWDRYVQEKELVEKACLDVEAIKMKIDKEMEVTRARMGIVFNKLLEKMTNSNEMLLKPNRDQVQLLNVLAPYLIERKGMIGTTPVTAKTQNNTIIKKLMMQVQKSGYNGNNNDKV